MSRRLSARRGSVSAPDPLGENAALNYDPNRSSSSILTIVRVVDPAHSASSVAAPSNLSDSSPTISRRTLRRHGGTSGSPVDNRLSFAFSSFSPISSPQPPSPPPPTGPQNHPSRITPGSSPSSSPRLRASSPQFVRRHSASGGSTFVRPNLSPEQLVDLARQSSTPRYITGSTVTPTPSNSSNTTDTPTSLAKFTLLPADVYLPFIDRATETAHLLSSHPTKKLFSLLAQTLPSLAHQEAQDPFTVDPAWWTFDTLRRWLTEVDRPSASDAVWVNKARKCVLAHSELIWERLKGALGVPPDLELEDSDALHAPPAESTPDIPSEGDILIRDEHLHQISDLIPSTSSPEPYLAIEPILATSSSQPPPTPGGGAPPPSSLPAGLSYSASMPQVDQGLQDIVEDREEEDEMNIDTGDEDCTKAEDDSEPQIHGLRICTSPIPSLAAVIPHVFSYPSSPALSLSTSGRNSVEPRSPDLSQFPHARRLSRTSSHGSTTSVGRPLFGWGILQASGN